MEVQDKLRLRPLPGLSTLLDEGVGLAVQDRPHLRLDSEAPSYYSESGILTAVQDKLHPSHGCAAGCSLSFSNFQTQGQRWFEWNKWHGIGRETEVVGARADTRSDWYY